MACGALHVALLLYSNTAPYLCLWRFGGGGGLARVACSLLTDTALKEVGGASTTGSSSSGSPELIRESTIAIRMQPTEKPDT